MTKKPRKYDKELENKVARDIIKDCLIRILKKEYPHIVKSIKEEDDLPEIKDDYFELCNEIHKLIDDLPKNVKDKLWDLVYKRYEP